MRYTVTVPTVSPEPVAEFVVEGDAKDYALERFRRLPTIDWVPQGNVIITDTETGNSITL